MSKRCCFFVLSVLAILINPRQGFAHTISQHIQEMYGQAYLPLFILGALLPFVGPGVLAGKVSAGKKQFAIHLPLLLSVALGALGGFYIEVPEFILIFNRVSILLIGIVLVTVRGSVRSISKIFTVVLGLTLGMESGMYIDHGMEYRWLYILILAFGLLTFHIFSNIRFGQKTKAASFHLITGILLILSGLIVVLLT